jgi:hypothetical protein
LRTDQEVSTLNMVQNWFELPVPKAVLVRRFAASFFVGISGDTSRCIQRRPQGILLH